MDKWKYYDIGHRNHLLCNPISDVKFERLCRTFQLKKGSRILDIACGKGEFLIRLVELYDISGVGVDISPYCIKDLNKKKQARVPGSDLRFIEMDGSDYEPGSDGPFDMTMCIGADWIFKGPLGTIRAMKDFAKEEGLITIGLAFWRKEPPEEYLEISKQKREDFGTHRENVMMGESEGLTCVQTFVSNQDDWDQYQTQQWWAFDQHFRAHPDDPDNPELLEKMKKDKDLFLRWERDILSWAIYVFRK